MVGKDEEIIRRKSTCYGDTFAKTDVKSTRARVKNEYINGN